MTRVPTQPAQLSRGAAAVGRGAYCWAHTLSESCGCVASRGSQWVRYHSNRTRSSCSCVQPPAPAEVERAPSKGVHCWNVSSHPPQPQQPNLSAKYNFHFIIGLWPSSECVRSQFRLSQAGIESLRDISPQALVAGELQPFVSGAETVTIDTSGSEKHSKLRFCLGLGAIIVGFVLVHLLAQLILAIILF